MGVEQMTVREVHDIEIGDHAAVLTVLTRFFADNDIVEQGGLAISLMVLPRCNDAGELEHYYELDISAPVWVRARSVDGRIGEEVTT